MTTWYPTWWLDLAVPIAGTTAQRRSQVEDDTVVRWEMPVTWFRLERNDFSMSDILEVRADWAKAGIDPRLMYSATCEFSLKNGPRPEQQTWGVSSAPSNLRFAGIMQKPSRRWTDTNRTVSMLFHDYTSFFIAEKPFVTKGLPDFSQTLSQAWARICDHVGPTDPDNNNETITVIGRNLRNNILFLGDARDVVIGDAVAERFKKDKIGAAGPIDAWAVWQQCVQMCGLISYIDTDHLVITTATDYYSSTNPPRLITGRNILELEEERDTQRSASGIILESFDPMSGTTIEAFSPEIGNSSVRGKTLGTKKAKTADQIIRAENREVYFLPGITDVGRLQILADRYQAERSRQELVGRVTTGAMEVDATDGSTFDLLDLKSGDVISIEIERDLFQQILNMNPTTGTGVEARVAWLVQNGYAEGPARVLVDNLDGYAKLGTTFFVKSVVTECDVQEESFRIEVFFCNRIFKDGNAKP